ncbi:hypothetical protein Q8A67_001299 [Cirrhinus molitorella]|uniref:Uncharacterized protein n=1 Tax=Cirrhinus molitorella TaxID=172907 RepID=A0AA88QLV4_9TELE|nr:hypothetical protein Q8A67_001299 [Cirrhinus molitorella]
MFTSGVRANQGSASADNRRSPLRLDFVSASAEKTQDVCRRGAEERWTPNQQSAKKQGPAANQTDGGLERSKEVQTHTQNSVCDHSRLRNHPCIPFRESQRVSRNEGSRP